MRRLDLVAAGRAEGRDDQRPVDFTNIRLFLLHRPSAGQTPYGRRDNS